MLGPWGTSPISISEIQKFGKPRDIQEPRRRRSAGRPRAAGRHSLRVDGSAHGSTVAASARCSGGVGQVPQRCLRCPPCWLYTFTFDC